MVALGGLIDFPAAALSLDAVNGQTIQGSLRAMRSGMNDAGTVSANPVLRTWPTAQTHFVGLIVYPK